MFFRMPCIFFLLDHYSSILKLDHTSVAKILPRSFIILTPVNLIFFGINPMFSKRENGKK